MFKGTTLLVSKRNHSRDVFCIVFCLSALAFGLSRASQTIAVSEQETECDFTTSSSTDCNAYRGSRLEGHFATPGKDQLNVNIDNLKEKHTTGRRSIEVSDVGEIWSNVVFNSEAEARTFLHKATDKLETLKRDSKRSSVPDGVMILQQNSNLTLVSSKVLTRYDVFPGSGQANETHISQHSLSVLNHSESDVIGGKLHNKNEFLLPEGESTAVMSNDENTAVFEQSFRLPDLQITSDYLKEISKAENKFSPAYLEPVYDKTGESKNETDVVLKIAKNVLFNSSMNGNTTWQHLPIYSSCIDGKNKCNGYVQNNHGTAMKTHANNTKKQDEKLSGINSKEVSTMDETKTFSEIYLKIVSPREAAHLFSDVQLEVRETTRLFSEKEHKVFPGGPIADKFVNSLNTLQTNRTSRPQHAKPALFLSKFGNSRGKRNVEQHASQLNNSINISDKHSYMDGKSTSENKAMLSRVMTTRKLMSSASESTSGYVDMHGVFIPGNISSRHEQTSALTPKSNTFSNNVCFIDHDSCKDRCNSTTNSPCSCHWTCTLYSTCCEDIKQHCPLMAGQDSKMEDQLRSSTFQCKDGYFFVSSCQPGFDSDKWQQMKTWARRTVADNDQVGWWFHFADKTFDDIQLRQGCESTNLTLDLIYKVPVTDTATQVHFKNVFCAICHNISQVDFWVTLANCDSKSSAAGSEDAAMPRSPGVAFDSTWSTPFGSSYLNRINQKCQITWFLEDGGHACDFNRQESLGSIFGMLNESTTHSSVAKDMRRLTKDAMLRRERQNLSCASADDGQIDKLSKNNLTHITESKISTSFNHQHCPRSISRLPADGGVWYTIRHLLPTQFDPTATPEWNVTAGIDGGYLEQILHQTEQQSLEPESDVPFEGVCIARSAHLLISTTFTFERTGLLTGDFSLEVQKHIKLMVEMFGSTASNTSCIAATSNHSLKEVTSHVFSNHVEMNCSDHPLTPATPLDSADNNANSENNKNKDNRLQRFAEFVNARLNILVQQDGAVGLPVTIEYHTCLYSGLTSIKGTQPCSYCTRTTASWGIQRSVDAIFGRISLEALVSIICCLLSIIGLISRLVLQKLVPFFNSYPGKVQFCLCVSLLLAYTFFLMGGLVQDRTRPCTIIAIITHLAFLSSLLWMNVTAFEIWRTFRHWSSQVMSRGVKSLILSALYSIGIPALIVTAAVILEELWPWSEYAPYYGRPSCWLNGTKAVAMFFVAPCSIISFTNVIFIVLTLRGLRQQRTSLSEFRKPKNNMAVTDTTIVVKIIFLVGITWLFGLLATLINNDIFWIIFTILNASLGFFISLVLVFNRRVMATLKKTWQSYRADSISTSLRISVTKAGLKAESSH